MRDVLAATVIATALSSASAVGDEIKIDDLVVAGTIPAAQRDAEVNVAAKALYQFWNMGDEASLKAAIAPSSPTTLCRLVAHRGRTVRRSLHGISAQRFPISASRSGK